MNKHSVLFSLQNFLFATKDEDSPMKVIDFGLSDFIRPGKYRSFLCTLIYFLEYTLDINMFEIMCMSYENV